MKKIIIVATLFLVAFAVQAQEKVKDTYVKEGNLVKATLHHDNGSVAQIGFFTKDGELTGQWVSFDRSGTKTAEAHYDRGAKIGTWFFWTEDKLTEVDYTDSKVASVNVWENSGKSEVVINK